MTPKYDPSANPTLPWLALGEGEQIDSVVDHHRVHVATLKGDRVRLHAVLHVVVEKQLVAEDLPVARETLERLLHAGLSRHEAVHAIADAATDEIMAVLRDRRPFDREQYDAKLRAIDPRPWLPAKNV